MRLTLHTIGLRCRNLGSELGNCWEYTALSPTDRLITNNQSDRESKEGASPVVNREVLYKCPIMTAIMTRLGLSQGEKIASHRVCPLP